MPTAEAVKCRCGLRMVQTAKGTMLCENCDQAQPQEEFGIERTKTVYDVRYDTYWLDVIYKEYPIMPDGWDKQKPGVVWPPVEPTQEETPDE